MNIFGFEIKRKNQTALTSIVPPSAVDGDGSTVVNTSFGVNSGGYYGLVVDLDSIVKNENDLIRRYRETAQYSDCDGAIDDIVNEAIVADGVHQPVTIVLDDVNVSANIKNKFKEEFQNILKVLKFNDRAHELFRNWYIDGRLYFHILINENNLKQGIVELRHIDPRKIRRIKNIVKEKNAQGVEVVKTVEEFYLYNDKGISDAATQGVKMSLDSVLYVPSGYIEQNTGMMMSYLHKAIKPVNQLKMIEDALVIYRISRAPERRIFYVDVGNLPKLKAEQYVNDIMNKFRNKIVYDATTGETRDDRKHLSMMEDFWMPRREGGKGTEITTLPGGQNLGEIQDIEYFQSKLYHALNVPLSRLQAQQGFSIGRSTEISREEIKFNKFIVRLRRKFSVMFTDALRVQLIAKNIIKPEEWDEIKQDIRYDFVEDNHYSELKDSEVLLQRVNMLAQLDPFVGKYYSLEWVRKNVLQLKEDDIKDIDAQIEKEREDQLTHAEQLGTLDGAQQTAAQNFMTQNAIAPPEDAAAQDGGQDQQDSAPAPAAPEDKPTKTSSKKSQKGSWPN
jgi:hypothetical protein